AQIEQLSPEKFNHYSLRRLANAEKTAGNIDKAKHYFIYLARQVDKEPDSADGLILRDIGRFYRDSQQVQSAHHY
ncbi:hypothetical protein ACK4SH_36250, partial [Proteus mirabilis]